MKEIDSYIKKCNLVFADDQSLDSNNTNLYHLASSFNKLYISFKREYEQLEKLDLGENIEVISFSKYSFDKKSYRKLIMHINKPYITNHSDTILYIQETDGIINSFVTNNVNPFDPSFYHENIKLNSKVAKKYLDLFGKYNLLLDMYNTLKDTKIYDDNINWLYTVIDNGENNLLNGLNKFNISFGSVYDKNEYFTELSFKLGEEFGLDYNNCLILLNKKSLSTNSKDYDKLVNDIYIDNKFTRIRKI